MDGRRDETCHYLIKTRAVKKKKMATGRKVGNRTP